MFFPSVPSDPCLLLTQPEVSLLRGLGAGASWQCLQVACLARRREGRKGGHRGCEMPFSSTHRNQPPPPCAPGTAFPSDHSTGNSRVGVGGGGTWLFPVWRPPALRCPVRALVRLSVCPLRGSPLEEKCRIFFFFNCCEPTLLGGEGGEEETACIFYAIIKSSTTSLPHSSSSLGFLSDSVSLRREDQAAAGRGGHFPLISQPWAASPLSLCLGQS